jgi:hypothetical protein
MKTLLWLLLCSTVASAQDVHHHPGTSSAVDQFYSTWQRPDDRMLSCCNKRDCYATAARFLNGDWQAQQRETGNWVRVPPTAVEHDRDAPDATAHVCMQSNVWQPQV